MTFVRKQRTNSEFIHAGPKTGARSFRVVDFHVPAGLAEYGEAAVRLLVQLDRLHGQLSGPAARKLAERALTVFGDTAYASLSSISLAHL